MGNAFRNLGLIVARRGCVVEGLALLDSAIVQARAAGGSGVSEADYRTGQRVPILLRLGRIAEAGHAGPPGPTAPWARRCRTVTPATTIRTGG
ncbi:MAG: hypothetical protein ACREOQ_06110 [Gemmatimonadales bacterium]